MVAILASSMFLLIACGKSPDGTLQGATVASAAAGTPTAVAVAVAVAPAIDPKTFDGVYRAGHAMKSATGLGVNQTRYRELLQAFDGEVSIAREKAVNDKERQLAATYGKALNNGN